MSDQDTSPHPPLVLMGRLVGTHSFRGAIKLQSFADPIEAIAQYTPWLLRHERFGEHRMEQPSIQRSGKKILIHLPDVTDDVAARAWVGAEIYVPRDALPDTKPGEYYWHDLEHLNVVTTQGTQLGRVSHLIATGSNDVMVVIGDRERLVPFIQPDVVTEVDLDSGTITVDWDPDF